MGRMGPGHTSMAICSCMLMVAFSPRRRRVMQAARSRPGVARPGPARPRPGGGSAGPAGRGGGCGRRRRRPQDGLTLLLPARRRRARVSARGRQAGGGPSPRHPVATKQCECAGCAGGAERASRAAPHSLAHRAHAGPGPRARTLGRAGPPGRRPLTRGHRTSRARTPHVPARASTRWVPLSLTGHTQLCKDVPHTRKRVQTLGGSVHWLLSAGHTHKHISTQLVEYTP